MKKEIAKLKGKILKRLYICSPFEIRGLFKPGKDNISGSQRLLIMRVW